MSDNREVLVELDGPVAHVTLNRPAKMNAITDKMLGQLVEALAEGDRNPAVKVMVPVRKRR
jgi:enoyl-CoA hydratase/carnithine racemase